MKGAHRPRGKEPCVPWSAQTGPLPRGAAPGSCKSAARSRPAGRQHGKMQPLTFQGTDEASELRMGDTAISPGLLRSGCPPHTQF